MFEMQSGACMCRSVRFRALARPEKINVCHCRFCQQLTGSAYLVEPVFLQQNIVFDGGPISTYDHRSTAHGRLLHVHFCPTCGNTVSLTFERFPALRGMCAGTFDDPSWLEPDRHIFTDSATRWMTFPPGIACYAQHSLKLDGTPETPWQVSSSS